MTEKKDFERSFSEYSIESPTQSGLISPEEIQAFGRLSAKLLKESGVQTNALTYRKEKFEKIERAGIMSFKTKRRIQTHNVQDQKCWKIGEIKTDSSSEKEADSILLSEAGQFYLEESINDEKVADAKNPAQNHVWTKIVDEKLHEVLPYLDQYLNRNGIEMSSEQFGQEKYANSLTDTDETTDQPANAKKQGSYTLVVVKPGNVNKLAKAYQEIHECSPEEAMEWAQSEDEVICSMGTPHLLGFTAQRLMIKYGLQTKTKRRIVNSEKDS